MSEETVGQVDAPIEAAASPAPAAPQTIEDLLTPGELAAVHAARKRVVVDTGKAGASKGMREVVGLLALHGFTAVESKGVLRIDVEPTQLRSAGNDVALALMNRGVAFGPLDGDGPKIRGEYDVMEEAAWLLVSGVDDKAIGAGS